MAEVLKLTDKLAADMATMLSEHQVIVAALKKLTAAATAENKQEGVQFAQMLTAHARAEEEITYPAALLIGRYIKSTIARGSSRSPPCRLCDEGFRASFAG